MVDCDASFLANWPRRFSWESPVGRAANQSRRVSLQDRVRRLHRVPLRRFLLILRSRLLRQNEVKGHPKRKRECGPCAMRSALGPDPLGTYYRYAFERTLFPDYPRPAVWTDGYYTPTSTGDDVIQKHTCIADRTKMLAGQASYRAVHRHRRSEFPEQRRHRWPESAASGGAEHHDGRWRHAAKKDLRGRWHLLLEGSC